MNEPLFWTTGPDEFWFEPCSIVRIAGGGALRGGEAHGLGLKREHLAEGRPFVLKAEPLTLPARAGFARQFMTSLVVEVEREAEASFLLTTETGSVYRVTYRDRS